jgi:hypothetical protein
VSFEMGFSLSNVIASDSLEITVHEGVALAILDSGTVSWS